MQFLDEITTKMLLNLFNFILCYCYGSVSDQLGPSAFNKIDLIWFHHSAVIPHAPSALLAN